MALPSRPEYEEFLYGLLDDYPEVIASTLHLYSTSALTAIVRGSFTLRNGIEIRVLEIVDFKARQIRQYSYTVFQDDERIRWYDPQPHPEDSDLAATFPHHLHDHPDIRHNRKPAPGISFVEPNLPTIIADCIKLETTTTDEARSNGA